MDNLAPIENENSSRKLISILVLHLWIQFCDRFCSVCGPIRAAGGRLALLSVAAGDALGRPDEETLDALEGYQFLRTDVTGRIEISTDGERLWVEMERK